MSQTLSSNAPNSSSAGLLDPRPQGPAGIRWPSRARNQYRQPRSWDHPMDRLRAPQAQAARGPVRCVAEVGGGGAHTLRQLRADVAAAVDHVRDGGDRDARPAGDLLHRDRVSNRLRNRFPAAAATLKERAPKVKRQLSALGTRFTMTLRRLGALGGASARTQGAAIAALLGLPRTPRSCRPACPDGSRLHCDSSSKPGPKERIASPAASSSLGEWPRAGA